MLKRRFAGALIAILMPTVALAQDPQPAPADQVQKQAQQQSEPKPDEQKPPAAVGEAVAAKPTRGFFSALFHNLGDDVKHMPRRNTVYWLAGGAAMAAAVHPADDRINARLINHSTNGLWKPGKIIGSTPTILGASLATYFIGRSANMNRAQHLGMDELEAALLTEGIVEGAKQIARRHRPILADGSTQSGFSFPSGHAATTFAAATVLQQHLGYKAGIPTYLVASYVAMSRLHDNRHFASDVAFGAVTGIVIGRSVTWHGRNFYASPMLVPDGAGIMIARR
jgi:membrane-associated phospholipid phosphatase